MRTKQTTLTEKRFFEWHEDDVSVTLRNHSGSYGGVQKSWLSPISRNHRSVMPNRLQMDTTATSNARQINYYDVELEVRIRKHDVDIEKLKVTLRQNKRVSNKEIAEKLHKPLTLVEHWFRTDKYFAIPDEDIWFSLKELLGITTSEFDQSIMEFETKGGNYDMRNRIYIGDIAPSLTTSCGTHLHLLTRYESDSDDKRSHNTED